MNVTKEAYTFTYVSHIELVLHYTFRDREYISYALYGCSDRVLR